MSAEELDMWLREPREDLADALVQAVSRHAHELAAQRHNFYGYALSFGLEPNLAAPFPITSLETDLPPGDEELHDYYRYGVNEWKHWWQEAPSFSDVRRLSDAYEAQFAQLHAPLQDSDDISYSKWERRHQAVHQKVVLDALRRVRTTEVLPPATVLLIYISGSHWDSELPIVERSLRELNTPEDVERYVREFGKSS